MKSQRRYHFVILFMVLLVFASCHSREQSEGEKGDGTNSAVDDKTLTVGVLPTLDCVPFYVAESLHLFDQQEADVKLRRYQAHLDCDQSLVQKELDGAISDLVRAERLQAKGVALDYLIATDTYWLLITNRLARVNELKQLGDKMIAITRYSATDYLGNLAVDSAKPQNTVFRVQVNDVDVRLKMLQTNAMDAVLLTEPQATAAQKGRHPVLMDSREKGVHFGVFAFRKESTGLAAKKQTVEGMLRAYNQACDSINTYGLAHYADIVKRECHIDDSVLVALPRITYRHAAPPNDKDVQTARSVKWKE